MSAQAALLLALALAGCSRPWMADESHRIDEAMARGEPFSPDGVTLGRDAPRMAPPFVERSYPSRRRGYGRGYR